MSSSLLGPALALFFLTFAPPSLQTTTPTPTSDAQAVSILQQSVAAMGTAPGDSTASGSITITVGTSTQNGSIQVLTLGTTQTLETTTLPTATASLVYSGGFASFSDGTTRTMSSMEWAATAQTAVFPLPLLVGALPGAPGPHALL